MDYLVLVAATIFALVVSLLVLAANGFIPRGWLG